MADPRASDVGPKLEGAVVPPPVQTVALGDRDFGTVVRMIKNGRVAQVDQLREGFGRAMKRLRLRTRGIAPVAGMPAGSDQVDVGSVFAWLDKVPRGDSAAKAQVAQLMATIQARLG